MSALRPRRARQAQRLGTAVVLLGVLAALGTLGAGPAQAKGYRYWSFWEQRGHSWAYASQGPSVLRPDDGDVLGLRFSVSEDSGSRAARPRAAPDFAAVCADTGGRSGTKRVALVLDFGTAADAPGDETPPKRRTACARVRDDASAADALAATAPPLRYDSAALLCAVDGYPARGCGEAVSGSGSRHSARHGHPAAAEDDGSGLPGGIGTAVGVAAVVVLGAAAVRQTRRRRR